MRTTYIRLIYPNQEVSAYPAFEKTDQIRKITL